MSANHLLPTLAEVMFDDYKRRFAICRAIEFKVPGEEPETIGYGYAIGSTEARLPEPKIFPTLSEAMSNLGSDLKALGF